MVYLLNVVTLQPHKKLSLHLLILVVDCPFLRGNKMVALCSKIENLKLSQLVFSCP